MGINCLKRHNESRQRKNINDEESLSIMSKR